MAHNSVISIRHSDSLSVPYVGAMKHEQTHFVDHPDHYLDHQHFAGHHAVVAP